MTKKDLMKRFEELLEEKKMMKVELMLGGRIDWNCKKSTIEDAIKCLEATDEEMNDYLTVVKLKYNNIYKKVVDDANWITGSYHRYYVYTLAKMALA